MIGDRPTDKYETGRDRDFCAYEVCSAPKFSAHLDRRPALLPARYIKSDHHNPTASVADEFTPAPVHELKNKSLLSDELKEMKRRTRK
jgi:hypothetical protein